MTGAASRLLLLPWHPKKGHLEGGGRGGCLLALTLHTLAPGLLGAILVVRARAVPAYTDRC